MNKYQIIYAGQPKEEALADYVKEARNE